MFKKKPSIKNLAPLRSSDRRRITDQIISNFGLSIPENNAAENQEDERTQPNGLSTLRNALLPEGALAAKFSTTAGQDLKPVNGMVYVGPQHEERVLWIKMEDQIIPSVYTLWNHPGLVPLLHTPEVVLQKMQGGADLMIPGLAYGPPFPSKATKGALVAVASYEKPDVPLLIGTCTVDVAALTAVRGVKGHAVQGFHWEGDEIWNWSPTEKPGVNAPEHIPGWFQDSQNGSLEAKTQDMTIDDSEEEQDGGGVSISKTERTNGFVEGEDIRPFEAVPSEKKEWSTKDIDDAFRNAFMYSLHTARDTNKDDPKHGISFPIPQSMLISHFIQPYLPAFTAEDSAALQIKKTSWKNVKKFIKALDKEKLIKSKDRNGGETVILDVDFTDRAIDAFVPYKLPKKETTPTDSSGKAATSTGSNDNSVGQHITRLIFRKPKEKLSPIFDAASADSHTFYLPGELGPIINSYLDSENLVSSTNKRLVNLNPVLANAVFDSSTALDKEVLAKGYVTRDALVERIVQSCAPYWAILRNGETREEVKPKAGAAPKITIVLETRSGNKTATRVYGLELYHIRPALLAEELQKSCASSTSVSQLIGSSPKSPIMEIMVQGPQKDVILDALKRRGVKSDWVDVVDKTKGKKK